VSYGLTRIPCRRGKMVHTFGAKVAPYGSCCPTSPPRILRNGEREVIPVSDLGLGVPRYPDACPQLERAGSH
jgi:hypothetical protein